MEARGTPGEWGAETREEVLKRKRVKHGAKRRVGARRKVRRGITMNGCTHGLGESTCRSQAVVGGKQVGSEGLETICTDFPSKEAGCEWETYSGS